MKRKVPTRVTSVRLAVATLDALNDYCNGHGIMLGNFMDEAVTNELAKRSGEQVSAPWKSINEKLDRLLEAYGHPVTPPSKTVPCPLHPGPLADDGKCDVCEGRGIWAGCND